MRWSRGKSCYAIFRSKVKVVILTGYTSGLGGAIHDCLVSMSLKYKFIFIGRQDIHPVINSMKIYLKSDFSNIEEVASLKISSHLQDVHEVVFINNAGIVTPICPVNEIKSRDFLSAVAINYTSPVLLINKLRKDVEKIKIINISSGAAYRPVSYWSTYCSTKSAIRMYFDVISLENGISVQHFDPGVVDTKMQKIIRKKSEKYDELKIFEEIKRNKMLKNPTHVAQEICELIK